MEGSETLESAPSSAAALASSRGDLTQPTVRRSRVNKDGRVTLSLTVSPTEADAVVSMVPMTLNAVRSEREALTTVLAALLPTDGLRMPGAMLSQVRRNAAVRLEVGREFGLLTADTVATEARSKAKNTSALASRWRQERRVFTVDDGRTTLFPGFQFDNEGQPRPLVAEILAAFAGRLDGWPLALWFTGGNGWLDGVRPVDVLDSDADSDKERVVQAAKGLAVELAG